MTKKSTLMQTTTSKTVDQNRAPEPRQAPGTAPETQHGLGATTDDKCRICESHLDGAVIVDTGDLRVQRCNTCGAGMLVPLPSDEMLAEGYQSGDYAQEKGRLSGWLGRILAPLYRHRVDFATAQGTKTGRLVEIGSGKGRLLHMAKSMGIDARGVEPHGSRREHGADEFDLDIYAGTLEEFVGEGENYDMVTMWHVLEHVPRPVEFLGEVAKVMADDARLTIEVPNVDTWARKSCGVAWQGWQFPVHLTHFTPGSLRFGLDAAGLEVIELSTWSPQMSVLGWTQSILNRFTRTENLLYRILKRNWSPRTRDDYADIGRLGLACVVLALASPLVVAATFLERRVDAGPVVRVACRKR